MDRVAVPLFAMLAAVAALFVPTLRFFKRTKRWPFSRPAQHSVRAYMARALSLASVAYFALLVAYGISGPTYLDVWNVPRGVTIAGWSLAIAGLLVVVAAQTQMGLEWRMGIVPERTQLVIRGLFTVVRNPIFSGMLGVLLGMALVVPCPWTALGFLIVLILLGLEARFEEEHLRSIHGDAYRAYAARVGRFLPLVGRLSVVLFVCVLTNAPSFAMESVGRGVAQSAPRATADSNKAKLAATATERATRAAKGDSSRPQPRRGRPAPGTDFRPPRTAVALP